VEEVEGWARIATVRYAKPAVVVPGVKDKREAIMDLSYEFVGFSGDDCEGLEAGTVRPLP
jgi:hypothetical protein